MLQTARLVCACDLGTVFFEDLRHASSMVHSSCMVEVEGFDGPLGTACDC